jgi:hypothetical protein
MNIKTLLLVFLVMFANITLAQDKKKGFSDIRFSYIFSSVSAEANTFENSETLIPYGIGLETTYSLNTRLKTELGMSFKTTGKVIDDGYIIRESEGYSGPIHMEYIRNYFEIPLHLHYDILSPKSFNITLISGFKASFINLKSDNSPNWNGYVGHTQSNWFGVSLDIGVEEGLKISNKFGIFSSQVFGYYIIGDYKNLFSIDLKLGLKYNLK